MIEPKKKPASVSIPQEELEFTFVRSSGAGGQNVNKVSSKAVLRWNVHATRVLSAPARARFFTAFGNKLTAEGDLILTSDRFRDQGRNVSDCLDKLRAMIAEIIHPPKVRRPTKPTFGSKMRRLDSKRKNKEKKQNRKLD